MPFNHRFDFAQLFCVSGGVSGVRPCESIQPFETMRQESARSIAEIASVQEGLSDGIMPACHKRLFVHRND